MTEDMTRDGEGTPGEAGDGDLYFLRRRFLDEQKMVILSVNQACNLRCVYCRGAQNDWYDRLAQGAKARNLDKALWPKLTDLCRQLNVAEILLTGGEPTMYPHLVELMEHLRAHDIHFGIHTHGLLRTLPKTLAKTLDRGLRPNFHVSTELFADHQRDLRGGELPVPFIHAAKEAGLRVELKVVIHHGFTDRRDRIVDQLEWWRDQGVDSMRFQPLVPVGDHLDELYELNESSLDVLRYFKQLKQEHPTLGPLIRNSPESFDAAMSVILKTPLRLDIAKRCRIIDQIIFITTDFEFLNCKTLWEKDADAPCEEVFDMVCVGYQN